MTSNSDSMTVPYPGVMDLRLLRAFVTVARLRTFGAAAEELSTSQPALTKQIQVLERRIGLPISSLTDGKQ